jgi:hypothetical protein
MVPVVKNSTGDVDEARAFLGKYFYSSFVDVLSWKRSWQTRFDVTPTGSVILGDLQFGTDVRIQFGELGAYHVNLPNSGLVEPAAGPQCASASHYENRGGLPAGR